MRRSLPILVAAAFFLSGAAALVYQVAWQRILALHSGVGIYSIAMIVGAFMAGLGLGSWAGGVLSTRFDERTALRSFAWLELGVAAFGAVSVPFYYDGLYLKGASLYDTPVRVALLHFLSLLFPTALMGMSLPFLARASVTAREGASRTLGVLYGINVLGAAVGALVTPWLLVRHVGVRGAVGTAVAANLVAAALALAEGRKARGETPASSSPSVPGSIAALPGVPAQPEGDPPDPGPQHPLSLWMLLYAASGFTALSLEILWFRVMDVAVKSGAFTFGTLLFVYLLGNALGSLVGVGRVEKLRRPLPAFLLCQCLLLAVSALTFILLVRLPPDLPGYAGLFRYWGGVSHLRMRGFTDTVANAALLYGLLPVFLFGLPTALMGLSFPILQRAVHDEVRTSGRKVGFLQAANIAGCLLGSLLVGLVFLSAFGTAGTLRLLVLLGVGFALVGLREEGVRSRFGALAAALFMLAFFLPAQDDLWRRLHGSHAQPRALFEEDGTGVAGLTPWTTKTGSTLWRVWVNGKSNSLLPFGGVHTALGAAPALMHPAPKDIAIIGLGSGDTAWGAGVRRDSTERVVVYEIIAPQKRLLDRLAERPNAPEKLARFLADPRMLHIVADGRNALDREETLYDVIEMDALYPGSAGSGNLYSTEFFRICARRLRPGGLMCAWNPKARTHASFLAAFPYVLELGGREILVGSRNPIPLDLEAWRDRLFSPRVVAYLGPARAQSLWGVLETARPAMEPMSPEVNEDLFPRDEFNTPESTRGRR
jgi:spermidine synthase